MTTVSTATAMPCWLFGTAAECSDSGCDWPNTQPRAAPPAVSMFVAGHIGDRVDLRYFLTGRPGLRCWEFGRSGGGWVPDW